MKPPQLTVNLKPTGESRPIVMTTLRTAACLALFSLLLGLALPGVSLRADTIVRDNDRILFCGDSITAQGWKGGKGGFVSMVAQAITDAHPGWHISVNALGASGAAVGSWQGMEIKSRTQPVFLDKPDSPTPMEVKSGLDAGADIVVVMLGMNDLLYPQVSEKPADLDAWKNRYHDLVEAIRARAHPRLFAFGTITPLTEDLDGPKIRIENELNHRLVELAQEEHAVILPTHEAAVEYLNLGRGYKPDFHFAGDFVHPSMPVAVAVGMLRGLGETDAAERLKQKYAGVYLPADKDLPALSYAFDIRPGTPDDAKHTFVIHYQWTPPTASSSNVNVTATVPAGWDVAPPSQTAAKGDFTVSGPLDRLVNKITLVAAAGDLVRTAEVVIPAAWRIATGPGRGLGLIRGTTDFDPAKDIEPLDQTLRQDSAWLAPVTFDGAHGEQTTPPWQRYIATVNYPGRGAPGSVDLSAVGFFQQRDIAYGARWIRSDKDRTVQVTLGSQTFTRVHAERLWMNNDLLFEGKVFAAPRTPVVVDAKLRAGWNRLWFYSNFFQWQWQFSIDLAGKDGDDLSDLRYATTPPAPGSPALAIKP